MKQILVISGKGGTGKSVLTASFASLATNKIMSDCDVDAANLHLLLEPEILQRHTFAAGSGAVIDQKKCIQCGKCLTLCKYNAFRTTKNDKGQVKRIDIDEISCEGCGVCVWNCPVGAIDFEKKIAGEWYISKTKYGSFVHASLNVAEDNSGKLVSTVRKEATELAEAESADFVIIDGSPGIGCPVIASLANVDIALIVTEPTVSGEHDMKRVLDLAHHFKIKTAVCVNKYDLNTEYTEKIQTYCEEHEIDFVGKIPFDKSVTEAMVEGKPVVEYCDNEATKAIKDIWQCIGF